VYPENIKIKPTPKDAKNTKMLKPMKSKLKMDPSKI